MWLIYGVQISSDESWDLIVFLNLTKIWHLYEKLRPYRHLTVTRFDISTSFWGPFQHLRTFSFNIWDLYWLFETFSAFDTLLADSWDVIWGYFRIWLLFHSTFETLFVIWGPFQHLRPFSAFETPFNQHLRLYWLFETIFSIWDPFHSTFETLLVIWAPFQLLTPFSFNIWDLIRYLRPFSAFDTLTPFSFNIWYLIRHLRLFSVYETLFVQHLRHYWLFETPFQHLTPFSFNIWDLIRFFETLFSIWHPFHSTFQTLFVIWGPFQHLRPFSFNIWDLIGIWDPFQHLKTFWRTWPPIHRPWTYHDVHAHRAKNNRNCHDACEHRRTLTPPVTPSIISLPSQMIDFVTVIPLFCNIYYNEK